MTNKPTNIYINAKAYKKQIMGLCPKPQGLTITGLQKKKVKKTNSKSRVRLSFFAYPLLSTLVAPQRSHIPQVTIRIIQYILIK